MGKYVGDGRVAGQGSRIARLAPRRVERQDCLERRHVDSRSAVAAAVQESLVPGANGGVVTCLDSATGHVIYRARTGATGPYFASPVEASGRVYLVSGDGVVTVIAASADKMEIVAKNELGEDVYASPAIAGRVIYVRTSENLYAFGER